MRADSDVEEMLAYLEKRHPLYFMQQKMNKNQIRDLIKRLKVKLTMIETGEFSLQAIGVSKAQTSEPSLNST